MSKRSGNSLTLQDLLQAIGKDTARWYLVSQSLDSHIEIDVNKATSNSNDNPIYYVQYAHARINQLQNNGKFTKPRNFDLLKTDIEHELMILLMYYKHAIESIAINNEVQKLPTYLLLLSKTFHSFYSNNKIIDNNNIELSSQRYHLSLCVKQILANGLKLMKIKPLDKMKKKGNI
jgi:arginyl-tRNA synthetase